MGQSMRILAVSNFYPPHFLGGYELGCRDIVEGLREAGHQVEVLTSTHGLDRPCEEGHVRRLLRPRLETPPGRLARWVRMLRDETRNHRELRRALRETNADLVYFWNPGYSTPSLALGPERVSRPTVFYISDLWPTLWERDLHHQMLAGPHGVTGAWLAAVARCWLKAMGIPDARQRPALHFAQFTSRFVEQAILREGYSPRQSWVIPWGVDLEIFRPARPKHTGAPRLLYVGRLAPEKGIETAIQALGLVHQTGARLPMDVVGPPCTPDYLRHLTRLAASLGLDQVIRFLGCVPREQIPELYRQHDLLIFPSAWEEPFSITLVEALASGLAVVSTWTGGTPEIIEPESNGLVFQPGDAPGCARQIQRLVTQPALREALQTEARRTAEQKGSFDRMLHEVEQSLKAVLQTRA